MADVTQAIETVVEASARIARNEELWQRFLNGRDDEYVDTDAGRVPTIANQARQVVGGSFVEIVERLKREAYAARDAAENSADRSRDEADRAELARDAARQAGNVYPDTNSGVAALSEGDYFNVLTPDLVVGYRPYRIVDGEAEPQPVNTTLQRNRSEDTLQSTDASGAPTARIDRIGRVIAPGAEAGIQDSYASASVSRLAAMQYFADVYGYDIAERDFDYWRSRAENDNKAPVFIDTLIAPWDEQEKSETHRTPTCCTLPDGRVFLCHSRRVTTENDTTARVMIGRYLSTDGVTVEVSDPFTINRTDGFGVGAEATSGAVLLPRSDSSVVALFRCVDGDGESSQAEYVGKRVISPDGTVSEFYVAFTSEETGGAIPAANNSYGVIHTGPFKGRWVTPFYYFNQDVAQHAVVYSDDEGETFQIGPIFSAYNTNEWAIALQPDGSFVGSFRTREDQAKRGYCPPESGGLDWTVEEIDNDQWFEHQNNRSMTQISLGPETGMPGVIWTSTIPPSPGYANSRGEYGRQGLGVRISFDGMQNVSHEYRFMPGGRPAGYPCTVRVGDLFVTVYETGFNKPRVNIRAFVWNLAEAYQNGTTV